MSSKKILIVDDDSDFLESMHLLLLREGHEVLAAANGLDAIEQYKASRPDLVFLDIKMPGIDGYETFERIKRHDPEARVVFTSSYMLDTQRYKDAKDRSLAGIINKPLEIDQLKRAIRRYTR